MATATSVTAHLTTCPMCLQMFENARSLPCLHAFCLKCLQSLLNNKCPGNEVPCPVCGKDFQIPSDGLEDLWHHSFVQRLVDVRKASSEEFSEAPCEVCMKESYEGSGRIPTATTYCVDCNQKLCGQCSRPHRWWRGGTHQLRPLGAEVEQELIQMRASSCDKHRDEQVKLFCLDCMQNICVLCFASKHRNHNSSGILEVADDFRLRIANDAEQILSVISSVREQSEKAKLDVQEFLSEVVNVKKVVLATGDVVKRSVDSQINDVFMELESVTSESAKQAERVQEANQLAMVSMESFHAYSQELLEKGRPSDITQAAPELHERARKLLDSDVTAVKYRPPHVTFAPADVTQVKSLNLIGKLTVRSEEESGRSHEVPCPVSQTLYK